MKNARAFTCLVGTLVVVVVMNACDPEGMMHVNARKGLPSENFELETQAEIEGNLLELLKADEISPEQYKEAMEEAKVIEKTYDGKDLEEKVNSEVSSQTKKEIMSVYFSKYGLSTRSHSDSFYKKLSDEWAL